MGVCSRGSVWEGVSWRSPSLRAGGRLRVVCQEPGCLESPEQVVEGKVGIWYLGDLLSWDMGQSAEMCDVA